MQCERLLGGITKLVEAGEQLVVLNEKLATQRVAVVEKTAACDALLNEITAATLRAEEKQLLAMDKGKDAEDQSRAIEVEKVYTQSDELNGFYILTSSQQLLTFVT